MGSKQVVPIVSRYALSFCRLASHQKKFLVAKMFPVVMTVLGATTKMCMTTFNWRLASATSTNRSFLFLKGEGHHW